MITIIAAMDESHGIGKNGSLPWHCPEDMQFFRDTTMGGIAVMGRKTCDSLPRRLPGRRNIVITRDLHYARDGFEVANDLALALRGLKGEGEIFIIGGAEIYKQAIPLADRILLTDIPGFYNCDTFFPDFDPGDWAWSAMTDSKPNSPTFNTYTRVHTQ